MVGSGTQLVGLYTLKSGGEWGVVESAELDSVPEDVATPPLLSVVLVAVGNTGV